MSPASVSTVLLSPALHFLIVLRTELVIMIEGTLLSFRGLPAREEQVLKQDNGYLKLSTLMKLSFVRCTMMRMSRLTRTDQKFLSRAWSSLWKFEAGVRWVELEVKGGCLDGLLFVAGEPRQAVSEGVSDAEFLHLRFSQGLERVLSLPPSPAAGAALSRSSASAPRGCAATSRPATEPVLIFQETRRNSIRSTTAWPMSLPASRPWKLSNW